MRHHNADVVEAGKNMIIAYLDVAKEARPSDLEEALCGVSASQAMTALMYMGEPAWMRSPFCEGLAQLVEDGVVIATKDDKGWLYRKVGSPSGGDDK